jgi:hypothetical protein
MPGSISKHTLFLANLCLLATLLPSPGAHAKATKHGLISGEILFEVQNDWATHSGDAYAQRNDLFTNIEVTVQARLSPALKAKSQLTFTPLTNPEPGKDRTFGDQGLFVEKLYLEYARNAFALRAGKFDQKFGTAWDAVPGIWGTDFAEDYELAEQIGIALDAVFDVGTVGRHTATVGIFFADTTVLSESLITNRHRTRKAGGGAGNTEDFSSFSLALEGSNIMAIPGLGYHLAYVRRGSDAAGESNEHGYAATLTYKHNIGAVEVAPLVEYVRQNNQAGVIGTDVIYFTTAVALTRGQWNLTLSRTARRTDAIGITDADDHIMQASMGYAFAGGIGIKAGYRHSRESGRNTDTIGALLSYTYAF